MVMKYQFVALFLALYFAIVMTTRNTCKPLSNPRCINARILSLKEQQIYLLQQVSELKDKVSEAGSDTSCLQDFRNWYCDKVVTQWATTVNAYSSQWYPDTTAQRILGLPFWYPNNGEMEFEGWIPNFLGPMAEEMHWIELEYDESLHASRVDVYQILNSGGVSKVLSRNDPAEEWVEIYVAEEIVAESEPKILSVTPEGEAMLMKYIRLELDQSAAENNPIQIDAVSMTGKRNCPVCTEP